MLLPDLTIPAVAVRAPPVLVEPETEEDLLLTLLPTPQPVVIPDDEVTDDRVGPDVAALRAAERYPVDSPVVPVDSTLREIFTQTAQRRFRATLNQLDPRVLAKLEQPFGKDNITQCFYSTPGLRHVLLPLWKSGFLAGCQADWDAFAAAYFPVRLLRDLLQDYGNVPFQGVRGFPTTWETETEVNTDRVSMATAALLHFNGSVADLVRWIGGPHVGAHRDHLGILQRLETSNVDDQVIHDLRRIFVDGIPAVCNVSSTEENFAAFYRYGNHSTVDEEPEKTLKALVKDNRKGFTLLFDPRATLFMLHCHVTPQGVVDLNTPYKNPRPIFDSSFRPYSWCFAINDWTTKDTEPELTFAGAELGFMVWLYNLRITYPSEEIYIADDDVSGAFRLMKYHPNLTAMHTSLQSGYCVVNTGGTFGDNTSPSNFDPIGMARRQLSWYLWKHDPAVKEKVKSYLPPLQLAASPSESEVESFCPADADKINTGVLDSDGARVAPPLHMHVDDALYADVSGFIFHTIYTSVAALFGILGYPTIQAPSTLSLDKFEAWYNHERKLVGRRFNSRTLSVGLLPYKRDQLLALLLEWLAKSTFDLLEVAHLLGVIENHTKYARWARCWYFSFQNSVRRALLVRYQIIARRYNRQGREYVILRELPSHLKERMFSIIAREKAQLIWTTRQRFSVDLTMRASLGHLTAYLRDAENPWETPLGMIIPREPHFWSRGDASLTGGGAYCPRLRFWFEVVWSPSTRAGTKFKDQSAPGAVHINALEFIVVILQLAAIHVRLDTMSQEDQAFCFPEGRPDIPVWLGETDNTVSLSWENRATARTSQGQGLVSVYAELLRTTRVHTRCQHLAGVLNVVADDISRNDFSLSFPDRAAKLFRIHPSVASLDFFLPSPELIQLLTLRLSSKLNPVPCVLPAVLGQFVPAGSTISGSVTL